MKIADLDLETKRLIFCASILCQHQSPENYERLKWAVNGFKNTHIAEMYDNLIKMFGEDTGELDA